MGQKISSIAFRAGHNRKWNSGWYAVGLEWKKLFFYQKELEYFFQFLFSSKIYTKISRRRKILLFDIKLFKYLFSKFFIFVLFYRLRTHRRKEMRPFLVRKVFKKSRLKIKSRFKNKINRFKFKLKMLKRKLKMKKKTFKIVNITNKEQKPKFKKRLTKLQKLKSKIGLLF